MSADPAALGDPAASVEHGPPAGWYPDPLGPPRQLRWWDGSAWGSSVRAPAPPSPTSSPPRWPRRRSSGRASRRRPRRVVAWGALGAFSLGVAGVVIAVQRGQDVCEVSATGIKFCPGDDDAREQVAEEQPQLESEAGNLVEQAQVQGAAPTSPGLADLTGTWFGDNGFDYLIEQYGDQAVISEIGADGMTTAVGSGFVEGSAYRFEFQDFLGNVGSGTLRLEGDTLSGTFDSFALGTSVPVVLRR